MFLRAPAQWFFLGVSGLALAVGSGSLVYAADTVSPPQMVNLQKELADLLAKDSAGPVRAYDPTNRRLPPRLNESERDRLGMLLRNPDLAKSVTLDQALAIIKLHQEEGTVVDVDAPDIGGVMDLVDRQWAKDPAVIAFYRDALATRGGEAVTDLQSLRNIWDDSFVEPLVKDSEAIAPIVARGPENGSRLPVAEWPSGILGRGLNLLDQHYAIWANDTTLPSRLSKAVLLAYPGLTSGNIAKVQSGTYVFALLARTHDRAMIAVLRPFLADKTPTSEIGPQQTPLRVSEIASNAILRLLGEPEAYGGSESGIGPSAYPGPHPLWDEWDKQIAVLEKRLDTLPKN